MTEAEWLTSCNQPVMWSSFRATASDRKLRLLGCAYCRRIWSRLTTAAQNLVDRTDRAADEEALLPSLRTAVAQVRRLVVPLPQQPPDAAFQSLPTTPGERIDFRYLLDVSHMHTCIL